LLPYKIGPVNGREAQESGLRLKASIAPRTPFREQSRNASVRP
jgi:hypothetical protein